MGRANRTTRADESVAALRRYSLSDDLTRHVLDLIRREDLKAGERLPSVRALADRFSVAAPTMREALRRLQASGVVELRHGSGVYVRNGQERMMLANPNRDELEPGTVLDLLEARQVIEPHLAGATAEKADESQLAELQRLLSEAERHLVDSDQLLHETNMSFHHAIARFSGNIVLAQIIESLIELYSFEQLAIMSYYGNRHQDHEEHMKILAAIRDKDAGRARELMYEHIRGVRSVVENRLAAGASEMDN